MTEVLQHQSDCASGGGGECRGDSERSLTSEDEEENEGDDQDGDQHADGTPLPAT